MHTSYRNALRSERTLLAEMAGQRFNASVRALLACSTPPDELVGAVLYHAQCCKRACKPEVYAYVAETVEALEALGKLPKAVAVKSVNL